MEGSAGRPRRSAEPLPLRYLSTAELDACLPPVAERVALARRALVALATGDAEMPPKIGVHPRPGALLHAMPAWLRGADLVGLKWVSAFPGNKRLGLPAIGGLVVLNDAETGLPTWIMDAARITAVRTAAVSGVAIELCASPTAERVAVLGAGVQARSHVELLAELLPSATIALFDRNTERAAAIAEDAGRSGGPRIEAVASADAAVDGAQLVISVATLGADARRLTPADVAPGALVVAVDFATYVAPELARAARPFVVDDRAQFLHYRELRYFEGYPEPAATLGELVAARAPASGDDGEGERGPASAAGQAPTLVTHLGVGLADVVFADAIARRAAAAGTGVELAR